MRSNVDQALERERRFGATGAAEWCGRHRIGECPANCDCRDREIIDGRRHPIGVGEWHIRHRMSADIAGHGDGKPEKSPVCREREPCLGNDVAALIIGEKGLGAVAVPFHRAADAPCRPGHHHLLGIDVAQKSEGAADIVSAGADPLGRHAEAGRDGLLDAHRALAAGDDGVDVLVFVIAADRRARLHVCRCHALIAESLRNDEIGAGEGSCDRCVIAE